MNAIQQFAEEHGRDIDKSLASKFQQAVESVIGDRGRVIDSWVDSTGNRLHPIEWKVSIVSDDMEDDGREICLELVTDFEGKSHFICDFWDRDSNLIASEVGEVGEFDPLPLIDKVLGKRESKKSEAKKHTCSMQKKKESLAKKNESEVSLPKDVEDAMKKVRAYLRGNYASIVDSGLVSDADCSVGYQLDNALNVLDDIVANFPKG